MGEISGQIPAGGWPAATVDYGMFAAFVLLNISLVMTMVITWAWLMRRRRR